MQQQQQQLSTTQEKKMIVIPWLEPADWLLTHTMGISILYSSLRAPPTLVFWRREEQSFYLGSEDTDKDGSNRDKCYDVR